MASSGKKGKKTKGKTLALTDFLQETPGETPTLPIRKSNLNWADEVEDVVDQYDSRPKTNVVLPTAPKASRGYEDFSEKIPHNPPFLAYLSNLPYDINEDEIAEFFSELRISSMRMPKEGEGQKLRGFGYVEFEDRDSLIGALSITDRTLKNRRIRIELATNSENDGRRRGGRQENNRERQDRPEVTSGDWRSGPRAEPTKGGGESTRMMGSTSDRDRGGSWRDNSDRPSFREADTRQFSRDSTDRRFDRDGDRRGPSRHDFGGRKEDQGGSGEVRTRTKLVLAPRSVPEAAAQEVADVAQANSGPAPSIFGNAKPVDTSLREREIEDRLAKQLDKAGTESARDIRRDGWGKRNEADSKATRRSPQRRTSLDHSPSRFDRRTSLERRGSPVRRKRSPAYRRNSPEPRWRSPERRLSPDRKYQSNKKYSPDRKYSPVRRYSSERSSSPDYDRRTSRNYSPDGHGSPQARRKVSPESRRSPSRNAQRKTGGDEKRNATKADKSTLKNDNKHRKEDKASRDHHNWDMPKVKEPEAPNFTASNKYAFLGEDESE